MRLPAAFARVLPVFKTGIVMKRFISKIFSSLGKIAGLVLAFGYSSCFPVAYGSPTADYRVKGKVTDILNNPLEGIQVIVEDTDEVFEKDGKSTNRDTTYTDGNGEFVSSLARDEYGTAYGTYVIFNDVDGELGGGDFESVSIDLSDRKGEKVKDGKGWYEGEYLYYLRVNMETKKDGSGEN